MINSESLSVIHTICPPRRTFDSKVMIAIGFLRWLFNYQREEIQLLLGTSESRDYITPFLKNLKDIYGKPLVVVRDMWEEISISVSEVFPDIMQQICHYHFVRNLGDIIFKYRYEELRRVILNTKILARLLDLKKNCKSVKLSYSRIVIAKHYWVILAIEYILDPRERRSDYPDILPYLEILNRVMEVKNMLRKIVMWNAWHNMGVWAVLKFEESQRLHRLAQDYMRWGKIIFEYMILYKNNLYIICMLNLLKVFYCIPFLIYSCYTDLRERRVPNKLWLVMLAGALPFMALESIDNGINYLKMILISVVLIFLLVYVFFQFGAFGGADAKSLIVLSIIFPEFFTIYLFGQQYPLYGFPALGLFTYTVLGNSVLLTAFVPASLFLYNIYNLRKENIQNPLYLFIGFKTRPDRLKNMHVKLMHEYIHTNTGIKTVYRRSGIPLTDDLIFELSKMEQEGLIDKVWVTPGLPFMLSITAGFVSAVIFGDMLFYFASNILVH